jgi:hypothetical protein
VHGVCGRLSALIEAFAVLPSPATPTAAATIHTNARFPVAAGNADLWEGGESSVVGSRNGAFEALVRAVWGNVNVSKDQEASVLLEESVRLETRLRDEVRGKSAKGENVSGGVCLQKQWF